MEDETKKNRGASSRTSEGPSARRRATREPAGEVSRAKRGSQPGRAAVFLARLADAGPLAWAVLLLGLSAAILMVATEFSTMHSVQLGETTCGAADPADQEKCQTSGGDQHGYALLALALLTALMTFGAVLGRSKPATVAVAAAGVIVLLIALLLDLPTLNDTRGFETRFAKVEAQRGGAFTLELIAGALAVLAGGLGLLRERRAERDAPEAEPAKA